MIKICIAPSEVDANIIKGLLESEGIDASAAPGEGSLTIQAWGKGPNVNYNIFVPELDLEKASNILREHGFIK